MTKDEFIDAYIGRNAEKGIHLTRTSTGYRSRGTRECVALPCACDYENCEGWAMVRNNPEDIREHLFFYGPDEGRPNGPFPPPEEGGE